MSTRHCVLDDASIMFVNGSIATKDLDRVSEVLFVEEVTRDV